jgi:hypothetical protein
MKNAILLLSLATALAACTTDPQRSDAAGEKFEPYPGAGVIYVYRGMDPVFLAGARVGVDGQPVASLRRHDYVRVEVPPGQHRIFCASADSPLVVDIKPGQTTIIEALLRVGWMGPSCSLTTLDDLNGRERVMEGARVAPQTQVPER